MSDQSLKEELLKKSRKAEKEAKEKIDPYGSSWSRVEEHDVIQYSKELEQINERINFLSSLLDSVENLPVSISTRRLIVGIKTLRTEFSLSRTSLEKAIKAGYNLSHNEAGSMTRADKTILKAYKKDLKKSTKYYKGRLREIGKSKDSSGYRVRDYQSGEASLVKRFMSTKDLSEGLSSYYADEFAKELLEMQKNLDRSISSQKGKVDYSDVSNSMN